MPDWQSFGRALQRFSAGYEGRPVPYKEEEMRREEMDLRRGSLDVQRGQLGIQQDQLGIQREEAARRKEQGASESALRAQQTQRLYWENLKAAQEALADIENPEKRAAHARKLAPQFRMGYQSVEPDADNKALVDDDLATEILLRPGSQDDIGIGMALLDANQKRSIRGLKITERIQVAQTLARANAMSLLPSIEAKVRKLVPAGGALADPSTVISQIGMTPQEAAAVTLLSSEDPKRVEQFYNRMGLLAPTQIADAQSKKATQKSAKLEDIVGTGGASVAIQSDPEFGQEVARLSQTAGRQLEPGEAYGMLPADRQQYFAERARASMKQEKIDVSAAQGSAGVAAKAAAEGKIPLARVIPQGIHYIDKTTGDEVDYLSTSEEDMKAQGGSKRFARLPAKQFEQHTAIREAELIVDEYVGIAQELTKQPGANFAQALSFWAQTKMGNPNPGVALSALEGSFLRLAGALQGSRNQLSDNDMKAVRGIFPTGLDTMPSAVQRLTTLVSLLRAMRGAVLGTVSRPDLDAKLKALSAVDIIDQPRRKK